MTDERHVSDLSTNIGIFGNALSYPFGKITSARSIFASDIADGIRTFVDPAKNIPDRISPSIELSKSIRVGDFALARLAVLLSLATGACLDMAIAPYAGKGTGETSLLRLMYDALRPGDVVVAYALFDNYFIACELRQRGIELVVRVQARRVGSQTLERGPEGDIITWPRPGLPRGMAWERYKSYPETLTMRQVAVDARGDGLAEKAGPGCNIQHAEFWREFHAARNPLEVVADSRFPPPWGLLTVFLSNGVMMQTKRVKIVRGHVVQAYLVSARCSL